MLFDPEKDAQTKQRIKAHLRRPFFELGEQNFQEEPVPFQDVGPKEAHSEFWREPKGPELAGPAFVRVVACVRGVVAWSCVACCVSLSCVLCVMGAVLCLACGVCVV